MSRITLLVVITMLTILVVSVIIIVLILSPKNKTVVDTFGKIKCCSLLEKQKMNYRADELPPETQEALQTIPKFTKRGFTDPLPLNSELYRNVFEFYRKNQSYASIENTNESRYTKFFNNVIIALDEEILDSFRLYFQKAIRDWTKIDHLKHVSTFGIREYRNKSKLPLHTDRKDTHILSAIINIYQDHEWNLEIYDHNLQAHQVSLKPGEYILYESATCLHGRPTPFMGKKYANVFVHFQVDMISDPLDIFLNLSPKKGSLLYNSEQTLYSDYFKHGFSNALIAFEKEVCIAIESKRKIMLPKPDSIDWHSQKPENVKFNIFDIFDFDTFTSYIPSEQFSVKTLSNKKSFQKLLQSKDKHVRIDFDLFEEHKCHIFSKCFRIRKDVLVQVSNLMRIYGLANVDYVSMHVRRGDFRRFAKHVVLSNDEIIKNNKRHFQNETLFLITDEYDDKLVSRLKQICKQVICLSDINNNIIYDMLICAAAKKFIGTPHSSFSRQITRFRRSIYSKVETFYITSDNISNLPWWGK